MSNRTLTGKQERFCQLYTVYWNATRAAKEAGYSEKSAMEQGYQLLQNPSVKARIGALTEPALAELGATRERIILEYTRLAFVDVSQAFDKAGWMRSLDEMPEDVRRCIAGIEVNELFTGQGEDKFIQGTAKKVKFYDKKGALDSLAKCLGIAPDKIEHSGPGGGPIQTRDVSAMSDDELDTEIAQLSRKEEG